MLADTETNVTLYYVQNIINSKCQKFGALNFFFDRTIIPYQNMSREGALQGTGWLIFLKLSITLYSCETSSGPHIKRTSVSVSPIFYSLISVKRTCIKVIPLKKEPALRFLSNFTCWLSIL